MARSSKLNTPKAPQESVEKLLAAILDDALKTATMPFDEWWALSRLPMQPLAIPIDVGREHRVTQAGVDAAHRLTEQEWRSRESYRQTIARSEFDKLSFRAIGRTLSECRSHLPTTKSDDEPLEDTFFSAIAADYARILEELAQIARRTTDRHIPCHLFHADQAVPAFAVGPVQFLPRADWIARYVTNTAALAHILEVERRKVRFDDFRDQALGPNSNRDLHEAWDVLASLRDFGWVATVRMEGHDLIQSHQKASIIVGLAIDAIGLRFQVEDARRLAKAGRQHLFSEDRLATSAEGHFLKGWSMQVPGLGSAPGALAAKMEAERPFLDAAGKVLQTFVQGRQTGPAPHLVERWANALYWVGEARREGSDFMAVVNYGCAADGLSAAGGVATEMTKFAQAALNPNGDPTPPGSISVTDAVNRVYREGRNKLAHGEMAGLFEDLSEIRTIGDSLLANLFDAVTFALAAIIDQLPATFTVPEQHAYRVLEERLKKRHVNPSSP